MEIDGYLNTLSAMYVLFSQVSRVIGHFIKACHARSVLLKIWLGNTQHRNFYGLG